jgi:hypothetical protein
MGWIATVVIIAALIVGVCFTVLRSKALWEEVQLARPKAGVPDPQRNRSDAWSLAIAIGSLVLLGAVFFIGWLEGGLRSGVLAAVALASAGVLLGAGFAVRSGWVSRR